MNRLSLEHNIGAANKQNKAHWLWLTQLIYYTDGSKFRHALPITVQDTWWFVKYRNALKAINCWHYWSKLKTSLHLHYAASDMQEIFVTPTRYLLLLLTHLFSFTNSHNSKNSTGRGCYLFNSSLPLPPASQTLKH